MSRVHLTDDLRSIRATPPLARDLLYGPQGRFRGDDLTGRAAVVTGSASGIGRAITDCLVARGADVFAVDVTLDLTTSGTAFLADLTTAAGNRDAVSAAMDTFGRLDTVIACAGVQHVSPVEHFPEEEWDRLIAILLTSPFLLAKHAWPALVASGDGAFVGVSSVHGLVASPYKSAYVAAKHGLIGLVKTLALEGAPVGVRANAVCPGVTETPLVTRQIPAQALAYGIPAESVMADVMLAPHAVKRMIEPAEVANLAALLISPGGRAMTGSAVTIYLGWTAR